MEEFFTGTTPVIEHMLFQERLLTAPVENDWQDFQKTLFATLQTGKEITPQMLANLNAMRDSSTNLVDIRVAVGQADGIPSAALRK